LNFGGARGRSGAQPTNQSAEGARAIAQRSRTPEAKRKSRWFSVHRWLGILLGLWFALVGITGSVLVYEDAVDAWLNPSLLTSSETGPWLAPEVLLQRVEAEHLLGRIDQLRPPAAPGEVYRLTFRVQPNKRVSVRRIEATFAPASGTLLGTRPTEEFGLTAPLLMRTIYEFHRNVLLGNSGSNVVGIAGFLLLASVVTGIVVAWPRSRAALSRLLHVNLRASATRISYDLHRSVGVVFAALLLLATLTGSTLVYLNYVRDFVNVFSPVKPFPTVPFNPGPKSESAQFASVIERVRSTYPRRAIVEVHMPFRQTGGYLFYLKQPGDEHRLGDTIAWVDPVTTEILVERSDRTRSGGETLMHWFYPLHSGTAFGSPGLVAMCLTGLTPILLVFTGLWVWLRKRRGEKLGERRRAQRAAGRAPGNHSVSLPVESRAD
jgi:uncharacterized iron-regulated membrane protein